MNDDDIDYNDDDNSNNNNDDDDGDDNGDDDDDDDDDKCTNDRIYWGICMRNSFVKEATITDLLTWFGSDWF